MTVTHVMAEADARGVFGIIRKMGGDYQIDPSVKWIVVAEPLVCGVCGGMGWDHNGGHGNCTECNGNGLPDVQIVSHTTIVAGWDVQHRLLATVHGVVTIRAAVPIVDFNTCRSPRPEHICVGDMTDLGIPGNGVIHVTNLHDVARNITDEFGSQAVTPGHYAHPILSSPDGTDAATPAA